MSASKLVRPTTDCAQSFLAALDEFHAEGRYLFLDKSAIQADFGAFAEALKTEKRHLHKPYVDWMEPVPETILWFVKEDQYIGLINIRHRLNWHLEKWGGHVNFNIRPSMRGKGFGKKLLQKAMPYIDHLGVDKALLTVSPENKPAIRIIEFCGGVYSDETPKTDKFPARKRYWLDCT